MRHNQMQWDAQTAIGFVLAQGTYIEQQVNETVYPDIQYQDLVPVDMSAPEFTKTVTYYSSDIFGRADWINGNSDDIPMAGTQRNVLQTAVHTAGIGYGYGWEEIGYARQMGVNLPADDAATARRAYEEMVDRVALQGDQAKGFNGLIDNPNVAATAATTGGWGTATPANILKDFNQALTLVSTATNRTSYANTVLLPYSAMEILASTILPDSGAQTLMQWLRANNVVTATTGQPILVRSVRGLETAGVGDTRRMVAYRRDPTVLKMHIPMPHRFLQPFSPAPLRVEVPGVFRLGGLDIRRTAEVKYVDGI